MSRYTTSADYLNICKRWLVCVCVWRHQHWLSYLLDVVSGGVSQDSLPSQTHTDTQGNCYHGNGLCDKAPPPPHPWLCRRCMSAHTFCHSLFLLLYQQLVWSMLQYMGITVVSVACNGKLWPAEGDHSSPPSVDVLQITSMLWLCCGICCQHCFEHSRASSVCVPDKVYVNVIVCRGFVSVHVSLPIHAFLIWRLRIMFRYS